MGSKPLDLFFAWLMQRQGATPRDMLDAVGVRVLYVAPEYRRDVIESTLWIERERARA